MTKKVNEFYTEFVKEENGGKDGTTGILKHYEKITSTNIPKQKYKPE